MRRNLCSIFFGEKEQNWFGPMNVMYLCLELAGLVGIGSKSYFFILYEPHHSKKSRFLTGPIRQLSTSATSS